MLDISEMYKFFSFFSEIFCIVTIRFSQASSLIDFGRESRSTRNSRPRFIAVFNNQTSHEQRRENKQFRPEPSQELNQTPGQSERTRSLRAGSQSYRRAKRAEKGLRENKNRGELADKGFMPPFQAPAVHQILVQPLIGQIADC